MIPDIVRRCKWWLEEHERPLFFPLVLVLMSFLSFALGRLSAFEEQREPVRIEEVGGSSLPGSPASDALGEAPVASGGVVASKTGTKYHLPWCSGAARISAANKITFPSEAEAEKAGYSPAANCPGLQGK